MDTKRMIIFVIGMAVVIGVLGTITYAFFSPLGETRTQEAVISTGDTKVTFADGNIGITKELAFGESIEKMFTVENTGTTEANIKMYWKDLVNTYLPESLTYTLSQSETAEGPFIEIVGKTEVPRDDYGKTTILVDNLIIPVGKKYHYNLVITLNNLENVNQDADIKAKFSSSFDIEDKAYNEESIIQKIIASSNGVKTNFDESAKTDEGIFEMEDDYGTSYYFRGVVENNYVKFGKWSDKIIRGYKEEKYKDFYSMEDCKNNNYTECEISPLAGREMWWRIIRVNGDKSLRIIYDGTEGHTNGSPNQNRIMYNSYYTTTTNNDNKYLGWMYGPTGTTISTSKDEAQSNRESTRAKIVVDQWYKDNIIDTGYGNAISDTLFCNDRSTPGKSVTLRTDDTGLGYGNNVTMYGAYSRFITGNNSTTNNPRTGIQPTFKCPQKNDSFTVSDTEKGNGDLTYPVGLITADEIVAAGSGMYNRSNTKYYLYKGQVYWSFSLGYFRDKLGYILTTGSGGEILNYYAGYNCSLAPVINLSSEYANSMIGTGTIDNPYRNP